MVRNRSENHEPPQDLPQEWTRSTIFRKSWGVLSHHKSENREHRETCSSDVERMQPLEEDDFLLDVNGGILDLSATSQQGNKWNLRNRKDQRKFLWLIRKKHPKLVIGRGKCMLFCAVLCNEQIKRGAWFLHDISGDASKLSLPCMIRLECRHDVFHALGNARDRRDGERVSFLTNRPRIARKVESTNRHENLDSQLREGLWQQAVDADHGSSTMHTASRTQVKPLDLTPQILKKRSRRSEGGQIVQELNSSREGKYRDDAKGGWLDPVLVRKAREEETQYVKNHLVYERVLRKNLYGTRDAAQKWECVLGGFWEEIGLRRRQASRCWYSEEARRTSALVNGDDVTVKAAKEDAEWLIRKFKERYEIKT